MHARMKAGRIHRRAGGIEVGQRGIRPDPGFMTQFTP